MAHRIGPVLVLLTAFLAMLGAYLWVAQRALLIGWAEDRTYGLLSCRYFHPPGEIETRTWTARQTGACPWIVRRR